MAGTYPNVPAPRMAYDWDGTVVYQLAGYSTGSSATAASVGGASVVALNSESGASVINTPYDSALVFLFPELRSVNGIFVDDQRSPATSASCTVSLSTDTTTGIDGTWTDVLTNIAMGRSGAVKPDYRTGISTIPSGLNTKGVRIRPTSAASATAIFQLLAVHLYGTINASGDRIAFWDPYINAALSGSAFDWGDTPQGGSEDRAFRIANLSTGLTAASVTLTTNALTDTTPSVPAQYLFSLDRITWTGTLQISSISASTLSPVIWVRRATPIAAALGAWSARILATVDAWQ